MQLLTKVANEAVTPGGRIVVLGYPELVELPDLWSWWLTSCWLIGKADANELRGLGGHLNDRPMTGLAHDPHGDGRRATGRGPVPVGTLVRTAWQSTFCARYLLRLLWSWPRQPYPAPKPARMV